MKRLLACCSAALLLATPACTPESDCGEPVYAERATDEAWRGLVDARGRSTHSARAVNLIAPGEGQVYAADAAPPRWEWTSPLRASLGQPVPASAPGPKASRRSLASWVGELLIPTAHAHLPPYTGDVYLLEVTVPGRACPVRVLTSELSWQADAATWKTLSEARGQTLSLQVVSAYLVQDRVTEGPFQLASPRTFKFAAP